MGMKFIRVLSITCLSLSLALLFAASAFAAPDGQWFPIGPAGIENAQTYGFNGTNLGMRVEASGRATVIAVNPQNSQDVWLGTATSGVWHSTNGAQPGMAWRPMTDSQQSLAIGAIALDDCNVERCNTIYIGTGENNIRRHTYYGAGLIKGVWSGGEFPRYVFSTLGTSDSAFRNGAIHNLLLDGDDLLVSVSVGRSSSASQSTVEAPPPAAGYGIHRSSDDGVSWSLVAPSPGGALPTDLVESPAGELYAGFLDRGLFKLSTSGDAWCPLHPGEPVPSGCPTPSGTGLPATNDATNVFDHVELEWSPVDANVAYLVLGKCPSVVAASCVPLFYRTANGGNSWSLLAANATESISTFSRYTHALRAHPNNANTLLYGGLKLWRSTNGGADFSQVGSPSIHPDHHDVVYADTDNTDLLYSANDGGFYFSLDGGDNWISGNYDLQTAQFYSIAADTEQEDGALDTAAVIGGTQDNGTNLFTGPRVWQHVLDGDGGDSAILDGLEMYGSAQRRAPYRSTTGGTLGSFNLLSGVSGPTAFYPPYLQHPIAKTLYFASDRLFNRSTSDASWSQVSPIFDMDPTEYPLIETKNVISAVALARSDIDRIYVGHYNGALWRTKSGGPCDDLEADGVTPVCWEEVGGPNISGDNLPDAVISSIDVHPTDPDRLYITYSGFNLPGNNHVYTNGNGGSGPWQQFSDGLPNLPANVIKVDPDNPSELWLGSDQGVYKRSSGTIWESFGPASGMPNVPVYDIAIDNFRGRVYAGTFGRGTFMLTNNPAIYTFEGWMGSEIWDILLYGEGWTPSGGITGCTVDILQQNGDVCASGTNDAYSSTAIEVGGDGSLVTDNQFVWSDRPVIAACLNGDCVGDTNIEACLEPGNAISSVRVTCGGQIATARVSEDCPQQENPPSTIISADASSDSSGPGDCGGSNGGSSDGAFDVIATLASTSEENGGDRALCGARVNYPADADAFMIGESLKDAINNAPSCQDAGVLAVQPDFRNLDEPRGEDALDNIPEIRLEAPELTAGQLVLALRTAPGQATDTCFTFDALGIPALNQLALVQKRITTADDGAAGGNIIISQRSGVGRCTQSVATAAGDTAAVVAQKISDAFMDVTEPGTHLCESRQNAYDMFADGDKLVSVSSTSLSICVNDAGVGIQVGPVDVDLDGVDVDGDEPKPSKLIHIIKWILLLLFICLILFWVIRRRNRIRRRRI
ncbi:MAG: hypothetical protein F6K11_09350 [Leptolyngbya sp. SIO3F4]|nr:hypothetical protein [Leptolyngbya sp. SIO3F4]